MELIRESWVESFNNIYSEEIETDYFMNLQTCDLIRDKPISAAHFFLSVTLLCEAD